MRLDAKPALVIGAARGAALSSRRRMLVSAAALPVLTLAAAIEPSGCARAAAGLPPPALRDLDKAALALFDAAEAGRWPAAREALGQARTAAGAAAKLESAYTEAGGRLGNFFQARNDLTGDLIEARTALAAKDRRWLVSSADRIAARAGELSQPFAGHGDALAARLDTLLFLARRMRRALVWQDDIGFRGAHADFRRMWQALRGELAGEPADRLRALDGSLARLESSRSSADVKALDTAVRALRPGTR